MSDPRATTGSDRAVAGSAGAPIVTLALALLVAACGAVDGTRPEGSVPTAPIDVGSLPPPLEATPAVTQPSGTDQPSATEGHGAAPPGSARPGARTVVIDGSLLAVLPQDVEGAQLVESPEAEVASIADGALVEHVARLAVGLVSDAEGADWAIATVSELRPDAWSETFFRDWRDSYDEAVCKRAGGVTGTAQAEIGGRLTLIGSCTNGVHTYHVHLPEGDLLVSITALGDRRFGEVMVEGLEPPEPGA